MNKKNWNILQNYTNTAKQRKSLTLMCWLIPIKSQIRNPWIHRHRRYFEPCDAPGWPWRGRGTAPARRGRWPGTGDTFFYNLKNRGVYFPSSSSGHLLGLFIQTYRRDAAIFTTSRFTVDVLLAKSCCPLTFLHPKKLMLP